MSDARDEELVLSESDLTASLASLTFKVPTMISRRRIAFSIRSISSLHLKCGNK